MKKTPILILFLMLFAVAWTIAQPSATLSPNNVNPGYSGSLTVTGTNTNFVVATSGMNLTLTHIGTNQTYSFGSAPLGAGFWQSPGSPATITNFSGSINIPANAPIGYYDLTLNGYGDGGTSVYGLNVPSAFSVGYFPATFTGNVMADMDSSCSVTGQDLPLAGRMVTITPGPFYAMTNSAGAFSIALPLGTYTFSVQNENGLVPFCPLNNTQNATNNTAGSTVSGVNFLMKPIPEVDLSVSMVANPHRPGFNCATWTNVQNSTYLPANNVKAMVIKPSNFVWATQQVNPPYPYTTNGDTLTWMIGTLPSGVNVNLNTLVYVPPTTQLGSTVVFLAIVTTSNTETSTANNEAAATVTVTGSYDPNDKRVWTAAGVNADGFIEPTDTLLRYVIRFQNTGSDTAFNIHVRDTMDFDLDMATFRVVGASHGYEVLADSSGKNLDFFFPNILLVDSNANEPLSHGYIEYRVRKNNNLSNGTAILNKAAIYFDFNAPVITNEVSSVICPSMPNTFSYVNTANSFDFTGPTGGLISGYQWSFGDGGTSNSPNPSHTYTANGIYQVCLRIENTCGRVDTICQTIQAGTVSVDPSGVINGITLAPNPTQGDISLVVQLTNPESLIIEVSDVLGRQMFTVNNDAQKGENSFLLPTRGLTSGLYHVVIKHKSGVLSLPLRKID